MSNSYSSACATCLVLKPVFISWVCHILWWLKLSGGVSAPAHMFCFFSLQQHVFFFFSPKLFYLSIYLFAVHTGTLENSKIQKKTGSWDFFYCSLHFFCTFSRSFWLTLVVLISWPPLSPSIAAFLVFLSLSVSYFWCSCCFGSKFVPYGKFI